MSAAALPSSTHTSSDMAHMSSAYTHSHSHSRSRSRSHSLTFTHTHTHTPAARWPTCLALRHSVPRPTPTHVSIRQHTSAYVSPHVQRFGIQCLDLESLILLQEWDEAEVRLSIRQHTSAYLEPMILLQEYDEAEVRLRAAGGALELTHCERTWLDPHNLREREGGERVIGEVERERREGERSWTRTIYKGRERGGGGMRERERRERERSWTRATCERKKGGGGA